MYELITNCNNYKVYYVLNKDLSTYKSMLHFRNIQLLPLLVLFDRSD